MSSWHNIPWPIKVICAWMPIGAVVIAAISHGPVVPRVLLVVIAVAWALALLQRIRWIWVVTLIVFVLGLISEILSGGLRWYGAVLTVTELALLLHPLTRQFYAGLLGN